MAGYLNVDASYNQNAFKNEKISSGGSVLPQGHPLCMKYKNLLVAEPRIKQQ
jgi:hypothetical protein